MKAEDAVYVFNAVPPNKLVSLVKNHSDFLLEKAAVYGVDGTLKTGYDGRNILWGTTRVFSVEKLDDRLDTLAFHLEGPAGHPDGYIHIGTLHMHTNAIMPLIAMLALANIED